MKFNEDSIAFPQGQMPFMEMVQHPGFEATFSITYKHRLRFTQNVFDPDNSLLLELLEPTNNNKAKIAVFVDSGVVNTNSTIIDQINAFVQARANRIELAGDVQVVPGSEEIKNAHRNIELIAKNISRFGLCRKSYVIVIGHGEAVTIGLAIDTTYANLMGWLSNRDHQRIINTLQRLGFELFNPVMEHTSYILKGLDEFREHLGGKLTIPMIKSIGMPFDVHEIDTNQMRNAITYLADLP